MAKRALPEQTVSFRVMQLIRAQPTTPAPPGLCLFWCVPFLLLCILKIPNDLPFHLHQMSFSFCEAVLLFKQCKKITDRYKFAVAKFI